MDFKNIKIDIPKDANIIIGQTHFIKTVEDLYEVLISSSTSLKFGIGFCEASGACLVRGEGNDEGLKKIAEETTLKIAAGHTFVVVLQNGFPISVLNAIKNIQEVCSIYCATANSLEVIVAETENGRGIMGVVDGAKPKGIEKESDITWRKDLLRKIGYKR